MVTQRRLGATGVRISEMMVVLGVGVGMRLSGFHLAPVFDVKAARAEPGTGADGYTFSGGAP